MNSHRSNRGFDDLGFKVFLHQFLCGHRQGTNEVEHILAAGEADVKSQFHQSITFA